LKTGRGSTSLAGRPACLGPNLNYDRAPTAWCRLLQYTAKSGGRDPEGDASRPEVIQHHHCHQAMVRQEVDPLDHRPVGPVHLWSLIPIALLGRQGLGRQHQAVVDVGLYDHLVFSPVVPLARVDGRHVRNWALGPKLEVVGTDQAQALLKPP
jgi:hypothetical protein